MPNSSNTDHYINSPFCFMRVKRKRLKNKTKRKHLDPVSCKDLKTNSKSRPENTFLAHIALVKVTPALNGGGCKNAEKEGDKNPSQTQNTRLHAHQGPLMSLVPLDFYC